MAVIGLGASCARNPATGHSQLNLVPQSQEIELGKQSAEEVARTVGLYEDPRLERYVSDLGKRLAGLTERPNLPWTFHVVDDPAVNAFALPGGYVFVTRGILAYLDNEAQLATVMGHECGHVAARHSVNQMSKQELAQLGLGIGMAVSPTVRQLGQLGLVGLNLLFLKFSRTDENQADQLGLRYALRAGYDVREMPKVFEVLQRVSQTSGARLPEWLATHPSEEHRIESTREQIARLDLTHSRMVVDPRDYNRRIDGIEFGPNPREGFFQGDRFYHPDLKFQMQVPNGWQKANLKQAVVAVSPQQDGAVQVSVTPAKAPEAALQQFFAQQGVRLVGPSAVLPGAQAAQFTAATEQGEILGLVAFVPHQGRVFQMLTYAPAERFASYQQSFATTLRSFSPLDDPKVLAVQPARLHIDTVPRAMTLAELYHERPASVSLDTIALINQAQPATPLQSGQQIKWVTGGRAGMTGTEQANLLR
jgi:predicted Zn-dependent protease